MNLNSYIEHTLLKPDTTTVDIKELCEEAVLHGFTAVCVPPFFVKTAVNALGNQKNIKVLTVVGFPMGFHAIPTKVEETKRAIDDGADEIEMVVNIAAVKDGNWSHVRNDIDSVATAANLKNKRTRVIFETELLTGAEIIKLCQICIDLKIESIKNTTGYRLDSSLEMIAFLKENSKTIKIVAAGNLLNKNFAQQLIEAGASKISTTSAIKILK